MAASKIEGSRPRLKNLDDLFEGNGGINPLDVPTPIIETQAKNKRVIVNVVIDDRLISYRGHRFRLYEGERLEDMVESIRKNGVLVPIIVRRIDDLLEILAGHNRVNAAKLAGLDEVPALILENLSDEDAKVYVFETNLLQRSFSEMSHIEKAEVIAYHHSKMFSQGKRNDIIEQIKMLENPHGDEENETSRKVCEKLNSDKEIAKMYSLSSRTVSMYLRIEKLIPALKERLDNDEIAFVAAVTLSFLKEAEQTAVDECMTNNNLTVDMKKSDALRQFSDKGKLNGENVYKILSGDTAPKPNRTPTVKVNKDVYSRYFKPNQPAKEVQAIVEKALELYFEQQ